MARRSPLLCSLVALLSSALCRGDRRQLEVVEQNETGLAATAAARRQEASTNATASLAVQGQAVSSSAAGAASSSGASANGSSARQMDQPSESRDALASNLTAAAVQAHAALAHAVSALAEQQARRTQEGRNTSSKEDSAAGAEGADTMPPEEQKLQQEENSQLGGGLSSLATAFSDPRAFLMGQDSIKTFAAGMRAAIEHGGEGKCLATGEFAGYGCGDDKDMPKICSCRSVLQRCWLPEDPSIIVKKFPSQAALDDAKALLFGKCYTSYLLIAAVCVGGLLALAVVASVLKGIFKKKPQD